MERQSKEKREKEKLKERKKGGGYGRITDWGPVGQEAVSPLFAMHPHNNRVGKNNSSTCLFIFIFNS